MTTFAYVENKIDAWGYDRKIPQNGKPLGQAKKTLEEAGELIEATAKMQALNDLLELMPELENSDQFHDLMRKYLLEAEDAIGDTGVTLLMSSATLKTTFVRCLNVAYESIKDRTGTLMPNGIFVKDAS